ncbi:MAG: helix-turn-helix domain-containing protein, partial [Planctomycetota bacterium]
MRNKKKQNKVNGAELRAWREKRGLSQQDLEYMTEDLGQKVTKRTIGRIENG